MLNQQVCVGTETETSGGWAIYIQQVASTQVTISLTSVMRYSATGSSLYSAAKWRGVRPIVFTTLTSAPSPTRSFTLSKWSLSAAQWRGVSPGHVTWKESHVCHTRNHTLYNHTQSLTPPPAIYYDSKQGEWELRGGTHYTHCTGGIMELRHSRWKDYLSLHPSLLSPVVHSLYKLLVLLKVSEVNSSALTPTRTS